MAHGCATIRPGMASTTQQKPIHERWRSARKAADITQERAAKELGLSRSQINKIEKGSGELRPPYLLWAIVVWGAPPELLDAVEVAPAAQDDPLRRLEDLVRSLQVSRLPASPGAGDSVGGS